MNIKEPRALPVARKDEGPDANRTFKTSVLGVTTGKTRDPGHAVAAFEKSGNSPPPDDVIANAIYNGLHELADSIDLKSGDGGALLISESLDKIAYITDATSPASGLHRIADALEALAENSKPSVPVGLWIIVHEVALEPSRLHIAGKVLGRDQDGALWIDWEENGTVWTGKLGPEEASEFYPTYTKFREGLDWLAQSARDRREDEAAARATAKAEREQGGGS